ncbi:Response regulator receiver domain-containing protein [Lutimaribacter pacificus]|uniref:Response regulator receiver domain-containing protein n=1 Tax=Lutimaribacter pacificus TaxID=391948 RepID=A0A1H0BHD9_9RHOB|nr:response regulator [Lutimaribacter pacificus]SDN45058.1 Response regulator receiver domain-containing protein [Lutimaribacter pacificus]SHJ56077.1 Response regulator receiver domain-containing protein [Lutimaribacter pacificus]
MQLERILHVDDDEDIRTIVQIALETIGQFELRQCSDGQSAVAEAQDFGPQLLLLDVMMPEMSGQEVRVAIGDLPGMDKVETVFVTAKAEDDFARELRAQGALAVITKPFDPMTLADQLRTIWQKAQ